MMRAPLPARCKQSAQVRDSRCLPPHKQEVLLAMSLADQVLAVNDDLPIRTDKPVHSGKVRSVYWLTPKTVPGS